MERDRDTLKEYFEKGDYPTEVQFSDFIDSVYNYTDDSETFEDYIYIPDTQPSLSGSDLTLDMVSNRQAMFEPDAISSNFNFITTNKSNGLLLSCILKLTGTIEITFESDVLVSNASTLGTWASPVLEITAGTNDIIEFQLIRYTVDSKWLLKVAEAAI